MAMASPSPSSIHTHLSPPNNNNGDAADAVCIRRLDRERGCVKNVPSAATDAKTLSAAAKAAAAASAALTDGVTPAPPTDDVAAVAVASHGTAAPVDSRDDNLGVVAAFVSAPAIGPLPIAAAADADCVTESVDGRDASSLALIACNGTKRDNTQDCTKGSDRPPKKPKVEFKKEDEQRQRSVIKDQRMCDGTEAEAGRGGAEGGGEGEIADGDLMPSRGLGTSTSLRTGRKDRREFTASEKLRILSIMDRSAREAAPVSVRQLREKHGVSKSSLHRWRQQRSRLEEMVEGEGSGDRKRDSRDLLVKIKAGLRRFAEENSGRGPEDRLAVTTPVIMMQAGRIRDWLLRRHERLARAAERRRHPNKAEDGDELVEVEGAGAGAGQAFSSSSHKENAGGALDLPLFLGVDATPALTEVEYEAMKSFKVTKSWAGRVASSMELLTSPRGKTKTQKRHLMDEGKAVVDGNTPSCAKEATSADAAASAVASLERAKQNTLRFLSESNPMSAAPKPKKERREFSAVEKLCILQEMEDGAKMEVICAKYHTTKSSVFRWKIQHKSGKLEEMVNDWGMGSRKRIVDDRLLKVKSDLRKFIESRGEDHGPVDAAMLQQRAQLIRDTLLLRHMTDPSRGILTNEEAVALRNFKASKGWAKKVVAGYGRRVEFNPNFNPPRRTLPPAVASGRIFAAGDGESQVMAEGGEIRVVVPPECKRSACERGKGDGMPTVDGEGDILRATTPLVSPPVISPPIDLSMVAANDKGNHGDRGNHSLGTDGMAWHSVSK